MLIKLITSTAMTLTSLSTPVSAATQTPDYMEEAAGLALAYYACGQRPILMDWLLIRVELGARQRGISQMDVARAVVVDAIEIADNMTPEKKQAYCERVSKIVGAQL